jgi:hypothetical protein
MAIRFTISGSFYPGFSASWNDPTIWSEGIVPTSSDQAFIRGIRTTVNFASGYLPFFGTQSITVASTVGFPVSGSFYTYTDRDEEIRLNYITCSATQFISASIDTSYYSWSYDVFPNTESLPSKLGGVIPNGAFVQFRPGTIYIDPSMGTIRLTSSFTNPALTIENGGDVRMRSGSTLALGGYLQLNDGTFMMTGSGLFQFDNSYASASTEAGVQRNINGIVASDTNLQYLIVEGDENRTNTTLSQNAIVGDHYLTVNDVSGFEIDDDIFVGERNLTQSRTDNGFRNQNVGTFSSWDECFEVAGIDVGTNRLYVKRFRSIDAIIKATASSTELVVDGERFLVGDKVLINNELRTITQVTGSYDFLLKDYNFSTGSDLTDWTTDVTRSIFFSDWNLSSSYGLTQFTSTAYRHIFVRDIMLDNVKVEAWISNFRGITEGSASRNEYGVYIQAEPMIDADIGVATLNNQPLRTAFTIQPSFSRMYLRQKNVDNDIINNSYTGSYPIDGLKKITLESSKGFVRGYVDDTLIFDEVIRNNSFWGRCGLYTNGNDAFICTRYKVYAKHTKITLDSPITVNIEDKIKETGIEYNHTVGDQVIKLASIVTDPLEFKDLAFAYRGAEEYQTDPIADSGSFPYIWGTNSSGSYNSDWVRFTLNVGDYITNYALGTGFTRSVIIDFNKPIEFNRVAFLENFLTNGQSMTASRGIQFSGSNDVIGAGVALTASNWVPLTSSIVDFRRRTSNETFRSFDVGGPHTYRFLRIETQGLTQATTTENTFRSFRIRLNYSNSIQLNNTSDLNIGDEIALISRYNITPIPAITNYSALIFPSSSLTTASFLDSFTQHYTIISKSAGNVLFLDKPFEEGNPEKKDTVVKLNRPLKFSGSFNSSSRDWDTGRIAVLGSATARFVRRIKFENASFQHLTGQFPNLGTTAAQLPYSGFGLQEQNWYNYMGLVQGCTFYNNYNLTTAGFGMYWAGRSGFATRHCFISGFHTIYLLGSAQNFQTPAISTGNIVYGVTTQIGLPLNFSQNIYSYNLVYGGNIPLPGTIGYNAKYTTPYNASYIIKRNHIEGVTGTTTYSQNITNFGTQYSIIIDNNRVGFVHQNAGIFFLNSYLDKGFQTPFLLPKRGGFDGRRVVNSFQNGPLASFVTASYTLPQHNITGYIQNHNRLGYNIYSNPLGWWVKPHDDPYYRFYRFFVGDWRDPMLGAYFWLNEGVSASFDVNFDYYVTPAIAWQAEQQYSGALYMIALKNGGELQEQFVLPKVTSPTNFSRTFNLTGPGHFQIALAGLATQHGYAAFANISSRLVAPNTQDVRIFSNNFNLRYFNDGDLLDAKTMYNQTPTDPLFRLKGARIF